MLFLQNHSATTCFKSNSDSFLLGGMWSFCLSMDPSLALNKTREALEEWLGRRESKNLCSFILHICQVLPSSLLAIAVQPLAIARGPAGLSILMPKMVLSKNPSGMTILKNLSEKVQTDLSCLRKSRSKTEIRWRSWGKPCFKQQRTTSQYYLLVSLDILQNVEAKSWDDLYANVIEGQVGDCFFFLKCFFNLHFSARSWTSSVLFNVGCWSLLAFLGLTQMVNHGNRCCYRLWWYRIPNYESWGMT